MIAPKIPLVQDGQILSVGLVNSLIGRTEYAADLLRQYKPIAGNGMYVEPHFDGTRISYNQPVAGGATPAKPLVGALPPFFNSDGTQNARQNTIWVMDNMMLEDNPEFYQRIVDMFTEGVELDPDVFNERYPGAVMVMNMKSNGGLMQGPSGNPPGFVVGAPRPIPPFNPYGKGAIGTKTLCRLISAPFPGDPPSPVGIWVSAG
jgi:hypothetical protein